MANQYLISVELAGIMNAGLGIQENVFPLVAQVIKETAQVTKEQWQKAVHQQRLWSGEKDRYADSIKIRELGDFEAIVEATYKYAREIEEGRPPRDLKKMLDTSLKVRTSKAGNRYLYIPLWHKLKSIEKNLAKQEPGLWKSIQKMAMTRQRNYSTMPRRAFAGTLVDGKIMIPSPTGRNGLVLGRKRETGASNYLWGSRIKGFPDHLKNYEGMIRADQSTRRSSRSERLTIRTISDKSPAESWIIPSKDGLWIAKRIAENMQTKFRRAMDLALTNTTA